MQSRNWVGYIKVKVKNSKWLTNNRCSYSTTLILKLECTTSNFNTCVQVLKFEVVHSTWEKREIIAEPKQRVTASNHRTEEQWCKFAGNCTTGSTRQRESLFTYHYNTDWNNVQLVTRQCQRQLSIKFLNQTEFVFTLLLQIDVYRSCHTTQLVSWD